MDLHVNADGSIKQDAYVRIDGELRKIAAVHVGANGELRVVVEGSEIAKETK